ncbi:MAG: phosphomannomutase/phosphoglucomutase [Anaerolineae bacterium]|nr:phosphomannomutase/phosphoglucomutase [Anaerolineae bacterium]
MIFRAYDIRGKIGRDLTPDLAEWIGQAFATEMSTRGHSQVIIGRDNRPSSAGLAEGFGLGVRRAGLRSIDIGEVATPILYNFCVRATPWPGAMITGSHLPPDQNGFKLTVGLEPFFGDDLQALRERIEQGDVMEAATPGTHEQIDFAIVRYFMDLRTRFAPAEKPLRLVVDAGNGMAGQVAPDLLRALGHEVIELYCESDGTYPNHPADPFEPENLLDLQATVQAENADLGLAFDGDADRLGVVDAQGDSHATDRALIPLVWDVLKRNPGAPIVTDPLVSQVLIDLTQAAGGRPLMWKSGHSHIKQKMQAAGAPLGLETSGHVFIADGYYGYDDGIYTALRLVDILARTHTAPLHQIMAAVPQLHTSPQFRPTCQEAHKDTVIQAVKAAFAEYPQLDVDGVRVVLPQGWFIVRASNTEPKLSLRFEAQDAAQLEAIFGAVQAVLHQQGVNL